jgi:hypothetical protein
VLAHGHAERDQRTLRKSIVRKMNFLHGSGLIANHPRQSNSAIVTDFVFVELQALATYMVLFERIKYSCKTRAPNGILGQFNIGTDLSS